ncbi:biotin--[acetyl-CoA-carboxylase] ligase [Thioalkalivibrio sp.]|uniref:biotin--[acetyl-CoA-carboxylase] ligase n=1 Tax=Thioalkalivibrio sp. TaxID=2093813 RepID=UPI0025DDA24B|nr:biotin--[acetyl-CoA-carboxylase] ligase [Thioalkalivibrio sp.]
MSWERSLVGLADGLEVDLPGRWGAVHCLQRVDSTNRRLLESSTLVPDRYEVCVAREQTAGHGRRGRAWLSSPDASLTFSVARALSPDEAVDPALSLAVGVGVARGLERCGFSGFGFKWPNDLVTEDGAKLAGVLVEARAVREDRLPALVVGVGLNRVGAHTLGVDRRVADLSQLPGPAEAALSDLLRAVLVEVVRAWDDFARSGLALVANDHARLDHLRGRRITVLDTGEEGIAAGIDHGNGALLLQRPDGLKRLYSGEISVRVLGDD